MEDRWGTRGGENTWEVKMWGKECGVRVKLETGEWRRHGMDILSDDRMESRWDG